jgi:hypothetical protein
MLKLCLHIFIIQYYLLLKIKLGNEENEIYGYHVIVFK